MDDGVYAMFVFFGFLGAVIIVPIWLKERTRQSAHKLISQALEKGQTLDPTLMRQLTEGARQESGDKARKTLGSGIVLLALAGGFTAAAFVMDGFEPSGAAHNGMLIPAVILGALGTAFVLLAILDYMTKKKDA
jgi:hypothetical protein